MDDTENTQFKTIFPKILHLFIEKIKILFNFLGHGLRLPGNLLNLGIKMT